MGLENLKFEILVSDDQLNGYDTSIPMDENISNALYLFFDRAVPVAGLDEMIDHRLTALGADAPDVPGFASSGFHHLDHRNIGPLHQRHPADLSFRAKSSVTTLTQNGLPQVRHNMPCPTANRSSERTDRWSPAFYVWPVPGRFSSFL
jgi:hypothetical protein